MARLFLLLLGALHSPLANTEFRQLPTQIKKTYRRDHLRMPHERFHDLKLSNLKDADTHFHKPITGHLTFKRHLTHVCFSTHECFSWLF